MAGAITETRIEERIRSGKRNQERSRSRNKTNLWFSDFPNTASFLWFSLVMLRVSSLCLSPCLCLSLSLFLLLHPTIVDSSPRKSVPAITIDNKRSSNRARWGSCARHRNGNAHGVLVCSHLDRNADLSRPQIIVAGALPNRTSSSADGDVQTCCTLARLNFVPEYVELCCVLDIGAEAPIETSFFIPPGARHLPARHLPRV